MGVYRRALVEGDESAESCLPARCAAIRRIGLAAIREWLRRKAIEMAEGRTVVSIQLPRIDFP